MTVERIPAEPAELVAAAAGVAGAQHVFAAASLLNRHAALQSQQGIRASQLSLQLQNSLQNSERTALQNSLQGQHPVSQWDLPGAAPQ